MCVSLRNFFSNFKFRIFFTFSCTFFFLLKEASALLRFADGNWTNYFHSLQASVEQNVQCRQGMLYFSKHHVVLMQLLICFRSMCNPPSTLYLLSLCFVPWCVSYYARNRFTRIFESTIESWEFSSFYDTTLSTHQLCWTGRCFEKKSVDWWGSYKRHHPSKNITTGSYCLVNTNDSIENYVRCFTFSSSFVF